MELPLLNLYPLDIEKLEFASSREHIEYVNNNILEWYYYDNALQNNAILHEWEIRKKEIQENSAIYSHKNSYKKELKNLSDFYLSLDREFEEIITTLPVGQQLFRDTKLADLPGTKPTEYMPTSLIPNVYINHEYDITLILTIKSTGIKCHYYGDNNGICEWEVLLQKGLIFTETNRFYIPKKEELPNKIYFTTKLVIEFDITKQII